MAEVAKTPAKKGMSKTTKTVLIVALVAMVAGGVYWYGKQDSQKWW